VDRGCHRLLPKVMNRQIDILLVEDNPLDVRLAQEALRDLPMAHHLHVVTDGELAIEFLSKKGQFADATRPDLILLDLNLPRKSGREVLEFIKQHEELKVIPVLVLTTSSAPSDIHRTYAAHANSYIIKPRDLDKFWHMTAAIENFWTKVASLPT
jgi:two-component system, chemotaxis family, response regulator Rcp1